MSAADVKPAIADSSASCAWTSVPMTKPRLVLAASAVVAPVPPSATANSPVILDAARSKASSVDSITLDTISYTESSNTELAGRARLNNSVRVYLNNKLESEVEVNDSGAWKTSLQDIETGVYTLRLDEVNGNGTVEGRLELPFKREDEAIIQAMAEGSITVQPGNSLWRIARKYYGKGIQYVEIFERNSHLIKDPDLIYPGQVFSLPN